MSSARNLCGKRWNFARSGVHRARIYAIVQRPSIRIERNLVPKLHLILACAGSVMLWSAATQAAEVAATQPAPAEAGVVAAEAKAPADATTQPAAPAAATEPADPKAAADARRKQLDPRWKQINEAQFNSMRTHWADAPIAQTFKPGALVSLSLSNGMVKADTTDLATAVPVRVAVEGSKTVWMLARRRVAALGVAAGGSYLNLTRFDFDAKDDAPWQSRLFINNQAVTLTSQNFYGSTNLTQMNGTVGLNVVEFTQFGQPQKNVCTAQAGSLTQLRAEHPEEFRLYVLPLLALFSDTSFLQPGPADVYSVFLEIPADQKVSADLEQLAPQLDADDPADRDTASAKLRQIGALAVLAALRMDESNLSEEQKLRLKSFVAGYRRLPVADPTSQRHNLGFLIDCLEYEDLAVRNAAKAELENQTHHPIEFDTSLSGPEAAASADILRKQLLTPPTPVELTAPATQPAPQV